MFGTAEVVPEAVMVPKAGAALKAMQVMFSLHVDLKGDQGVEGFRAFRTRVAGSCK